MRKIILFMLCVSILMAFCVGCGASEPGTHDSTSGTGTSVTEKNEKTEKTQWWLDDGLFDIVCSEGENYKLMTNKEHSGYRYYVYDNSGDMIDEGYHSYRGCEFSYKDGYLAYHSHGLTFQWYARYYDVNGGRVSRLYYRPLDTYKNLVAYYRSDSDGNIALIVCDMFDQQTYYQSFSRDFGMSVLMGGSTGEFSEDGTTLTVTYTVTDYENQKDTQITETFELIQ